MDTGSTLGIAAENRGSGGFAERRRLRRTLLERRLALPADACALASRRICALLQGEFPQFASMRVGFCWPFNNEPDLRPLLESWRSEDREGFAALLPVVIGERRALAFRAWSPETPMVADRYGIPTPAAGDFVVPQVLLLPVNGFDAMGYRIGYGGGHFDCTLALLCPRPFAVGVGYELSRLDSIVPEPHDQPLDVIITEAGVFRPERPAGSLACQGERANRQASAWP